MTVAQGIPLKDLSEAVTAESWDYAKANTQHLTHNIHRYSGKFIPQIAARAISLLTKPGDIVLDPYCGSGTTLVESAVLHRRAIGVDLNPLAALIAEVKTTPIEASMLQDLFHELSEKFMSHNTDPSLPLLFDANRANSCEVSDDPRTADSWYRKWFQDDVLRDLLAIDHAIDRIRPRPLRNFTQVAFSDIIRRSSNAHSGYPNVMFDKNAPRKNSPIGDFLKTYRRNADMVGLLSTSDVSWSDIKVLQADACALPLDRDSIDAVISHPPYVASIPYAEYGVLSLRWLGFDPKQLDRKLTGGRRQSTHVVTRFEAAYAKMLQETARVLKPGGLAFLMVGNPVVRGNIVDLRDVTFRLASRAGLRLAAETERRGINRRANKMGTEHLLFFRNPPHRSRQTRRNLSKPLG